ncbi:MAG TPA: nitrite reductase, partial [Thermoanaerobaculia bacterium]|nr:nitrite reductase [Thermoanaerobaculia bacterium]
MQAPGVRPAGAPMPAAGVVHTGSRDGAGAGAALSADAAGYYGRPLLKEPTWTWEVPLYFFVGG